MRQSASAHPQTPASHLAIGGLQDLYYGFENNQPEYELPIGPAKAPGPARARNDPLHKAMATVATVLQDSLNQKIDDTVQKAITQFNDGHDQL